MPLDKALIDELLGSVRIKGLYEAKLNEFIASDDPAINPRESWPEFFANKTAGSMYQSFNNAKKKLNGSGEAVVILRRDDEVFIMHMERVKRVETPTEADAEVTA